MTGPSPAQRDRPRRRRGMKPDSTSKSVVLPAPLAPTNPTISPRPTANDTSSSATTPPKCFPIPSTTSRGARSSASGRVGATGRAVPVASRVADEHRADEVVALDQLGGRALEADLAVLEEVRAVGDAQREVERLFDDQHGRPRRAQLVAGCVDDVLGDRRREPEGQLVDEQHVRPRDQRHREREQLLLAAREVARRLAHPRREHREPFERLADVVVGDLRSRTQPAREPQVLRDRERREHAFAARCVPDAERGDAFGGRRVVTSCRRW